MEPFGPLVTTDWLAANLDKSALKVIDGSWRMPGNPPARDDFETWHIPGAVFFDIDAIADRRTSLPHMLPPPSLFEEEVGDLGISHKDRVVIYDDQGLFSAARVWWTFRAMGHKDIAVLDGGLPKWLVENRSVTSVGSDPAPVLYVAAPVNETVKSAADVRTALEQRNAIVVDARPESRFIGDMPEPRDGLRSGHMPGAINLPHSLLLQKNGALRSSDDLRAVFNSAGVNLDSPVITTCGSGVTAAVLSLALEHLGHRQHSLYDGSWAEWGRIENAERDYPVTAGK